MIVFPTKITAFLSKAEMQEWHDGNPAPGQLVYHDGGKGYYFDTDLDLQSVDTGRTFKHTEEPDTAATSWTWQTDREIYALYVDGVLYYQVVSSPGALEYTYDVATGSITKTANFAGEIIHIIYGKIWVPVVV